MIDATVQAIRAKSVGLSSGRKAGTRMGHRDARRFPAPRSRRAAPTPKRIRLDAFRTVQIRTRAIHRLREYSSRRYRWYPASVFGANAAGARRNSEFSYIRICGDFLLNVSHGVRLRTEGKSRGKRPLSRIPVEPSSLQLQTFHPQGPSAITPKTGCGSYSRFEYRH